MESHPCRLANQRSPPPRMQGPCEVQRRGHAERRSRCCVPCTGRGRIGTGRACCVWQSTAELALGDGWSPSEKFGYVSKAKNRENQHEKKTAIIDFSMSTSNHQAAAPCPTAGTAPRDDALRSAPGASHGQAACEPAPPATQPGVQHVVSYDPEPSW